MERASLQSRPFYGRIEKTLEQYADLMTDRISVFKMKFKK